MIIIQLAPTFMLAAMRKTIVIGTVSTNRRWSFAIRGNVVCTSSLPMVLLPEARGDRDYAVADIVVHVAFPFDWNRDVDEGFHHCADTDEVACIQ